MKSGGRIMTYNVHVIITQNWNIDERVLCKKTFSFHTFNSAIDFFEDKGIPLKEVSP